MMQVEVLQFLRPDGEIRKTTTELPDEVMPLYEEMKEYLCRFEAEVLTTGQVSVTVTSLTVDEGEPMDIDISVTPNGPEVQAGMVAMLKRKSWLTL